MSKFNTKNIMIIGDVMIDEYWSGNIERISPEAPVPIVDIATTSFLPGGAANVAWGYGSTCPQARRGVRWKYRENPETD